MKSKFVCISVLFGGLLGIAAPGLAESLELRVPFEFEAAGKALPAGDYMISTTGSVLTLHGSTPGSAVAMLMEVGEAPDGAPAPKASFGTDSGVRMLESVTLASGVTYVPVPAKHTRVAGSRAASGDALQLRR